MAVAFLVPRNWLKNVIREKYLNEIILLKLVVEVKMRPKDINMYSRSDVWRKQKCKEGENRRIF